VEHAVGELLADDLEFWSCKQLRNTLDDGLLFVSEPSFFVEALVRVLELRATCDTAPQPDRDSAVRRRDRLLDKLYSLVTKHVEPAKLCDKLLLQLADEQVLYLLHDIVLPSDRLRVAKLPHYVNDMFATLIGELRWPFLHLMLFHVTLMADLPDLFKRFHTAQLKCNYCKCV